MWDIVKKAINSNLAKSLDVLITEKAPIQPTKIRAAYFSNENAANNTWYTLQNVVSGKGTINRITLYGDSTWNNKLKIRTTIDGDVQIFEHSLISGSAGLSAIGMATYYGIRTISILGPIYFKQSAKVEIMQYSGQASNINAACDYALV